MADVTVCDQCDKILRHGERYLNVYIDAREKGSSDSESDSAEFCSFECLSMFAHLKAEIPEDQQW
jgi:hypothetical protein